MTATHRLRRIARHFTVPFYILSSVGPFASAVLFALTTGVNSVLLFIFGTLFLVPAVANALLTGPRRLTSFSFVSGLRELYAEGTDASERIKTQISKAKLSVKILDTYFGQFDQMQSSFRKAMDAGAEVQILVARKGGKLSSSRGIFEKKTIDSGVDNLERKIADFEEQLRSTEIEPRIALRHFDVAMSGPLYIIDDSIVFAGTFLQKLGSQNTPMFELTVRHGWRSRYGIAKVFVDSFDQIWNASADDAKLST
jgi:hypothetical protein